MKEVVLVVCAHSDDQILGPGATLAKYASEGKMVFTVICNYGETAMPWLKKGIAIRTRIREAEKADRIIGGKGVQFLGYEEKNFLSEVEKPEFVGKLKSIFKKYRPDKVFTHSPEDPHPVHRVVQKKVLEALEKSRLKCDVFAFDVWNPFTYKTGLPKMFVDVTDTFHLKVKALKCFPSQWPSIWSLFWSVYAKAFVHGFHIHKRYGERFFKIR